MMKFAKIAAFHVLAALISVTLTVAVLLVGLKILDAYLLSQGRDGPADEDADEPTMRTMEYCPFTGGHVQAFMTERKPLWSSYYKDSDVTTGEYGFFIDFRLEAPPPKQDNEISKGDGPYLLASKEGGLLHVLRYSASPPWLKKITRYFPGIVKRTMLGSLVRLMYLNDYIDDWKANYYLSRVDPTFGPMPEAELRTRHRR
jgi:hypothetical protein